MHTAGGPNYETVIRETDIRVNMGPNSDNIPSEWCGGEARWANLKRKARYIARTIAEKFAYCTLRTVSIEDAVDILQTFGPGYVCISCLFDFCLLFPVYCMQSSVLHIIKIYTYLTFIAYNWRFYILILLMHINIFKTVFARRTCSTAPYQLCQRMYCRILLRAMLPDVELRKWTRYLCIKVTDVRVTWLVRLWDLPRDPAKRDGDQRLKLYWIDPVDATDRTVLLQIGTDWKVLLSLRKAGVGVLVMTSEMSIWPCHCRFSIGISGNAAHIHAQCSFYPSALWG